MARRQGPHYNTVTDSSPQQEFDSQSDLMGCYFKVISLLFKSRHFIPLSQFLVDFLKVLSDWHVAQQFLSMDETLSSFPSPARIKNKKQTKKATKKAIP